RAKRNARREHHLIKCRPGRRRFPHPSTPVRAHSSLPAPLAALAPLAGQGCRSSDRMASIAIGEQAGSMEPKQISEDPEAMTWEQKRWLLRFPWDWPDEMWAIGLILVEQWEDGPLLLSPSSDPL